MRTEDRSEAHPDTTPTAVRVIGWIYLGLGVLIAVAGSYVSGGLLILLLLQATLNIVVGAGLVIGKFWAYYVAVVMAAFNLIMLLLSALMGSTGLFVPLSINVTVLYWLLRRNVRAWAGLTSW
jgi:uncharacterized membrane protein (DUF2068 family)